MSGLTELLHLAISPSARAKQRLPLILNRFRDPQEDTLVLLQTLVDCLRPTWRGEAAAVERYTRMVDMLEQDQHLQHCFRQRTLEFMASRRLVTFFTDSGILPDSGFFSEWWRILIQRLLPALADEGRLKDCLQLIYRRPDDWAWLSSTPENLSGRFWQLLCRTDDLPNINWPEIQHQLLDAILLLAHRISGLGVDGELMQAGPDFENHLPRFVALSSEALTFVNTFRASHSSSPQQVEQERLALIVMIEQCEDTLLRIRKRAQSFGTSLHLTYQLTRSQQSLTRLRELIDVLTADARTLSTAEATLFRAQFTRNAFIQENRRNSLSDYLNRLSGLLAMRVTSNAARSGEHYICESKTEYRHMWVSAAGAGVIIGGMALLKIFAAALHAPLFVEAVMFSLIYGLGFVLIYLLGMTVATKQPAMTAQTMAALLSDLRPNRMAEVERMVDVFAAVCRSQLAAILGNVLIALPVALGLGYALTEWRGTPLISLEKGQHLLADIDPISWALPHAAIAGFYLFLSGLITGYFDNHATYANIGPRISRLPSLRFLFGEQLATRIGTYIQNHLGGIMGNLLFGCMLGSTGVMGTILGLPLDIRHIAFASANLGYAVNCFNFDISMSTILYGLLGIALIGMTNLVVSFSLALRTALRARDAQFGHWWPLIKAIGHRFITHPRTFLMP